MTSLTDIAPNSQRVMLGNDNVTVSGISVKGIAVLFGKFPALRALFTGQSVDMDADSLIKLAPDAIAAILACGTGKPGDEAEEKAAENLPIVYQAALLDKIITLTLPSGVGPFVEMVTRLAGTLGVTNAEAVVADGSKAPDTNSPKPSNT